MKTCSKCGETKPFDAFSKDVRRNKTDGRQSYCKACVKARRETPEYIVAERAYNQTPERKAAKRARNRKPEYKAYQRAYNQKPERKATRRVHNQTPEAKAYQRAYKQKPEVKAAKRARRLRRDYDLSTADFERLLVAQGGVCDICKEAKKLHVDHCHDTGIVRGLICHGCNSGLGIIDNPDLLIARATFLQNPPAPKLLGERYHRDFRQRVAA